ncbi:MAG: hypothetical protein A2X25_07440 [Chloroflexi bacterium GWB2_49_20]|nr:MAG: hypothetical protein A2X25_07440 [Chloroflexi bacterium GWB2_49_20]OGN77988.1 MAG: hypothetical protein A2X26_15245 [Chloroflexi bacterium GWC2_49_37]OGN85026.1 MAG: hypothetical protein A2X27_09945 [Chloroflexi bacterium GWD2_49_16]HBG74938.1 hypothetical protein [Anaerolineae bacterium]HCC78338.1 hypothetical protein [Anaerolineae bacterium]
MAKDKSVQFPDQSMNDAGEIVDLQLWVDEFERFFNEKILSEIRTTIDNGLQTAPYILISCAIDFLVTFWTGTDSTRKSYPDFVNKYFDGYEGDILYKELRCRMVHNHTVGENAIICWDEPDLHKCTAGNKIIVLNSQQFFEDFILAKDRYIEELRTNHKLLENHIRRVNKMGVLSSINPDDLRTP